MVRPEHAGRYLVFDEIASGGMATVHLGRLVGPAGFGRIVAIKRLHGHLAKDPAFVTMLLDEARIASRIHHPNVVQTFDVIADKQLFIVLEYVGGDSLAKLVARVRRRGDRVDPAIAVAIMLGVLYGLHAAHETCDEAGRSLGIVHRDVSPQNVLVGTDGTARILDFGIAKASGRIQTTREGQLKGKLAYMAPEQLEHRPVDRRVDVYAAAVVFWELLTCTRLFDGDNEASLFRQVLEGNVAPPSSIAPGITESLDAIVARGLARDPDARFTTAKEMALALEASLVVPATASRLGEWVESEWPDRADRARLIAAVESGVRTEGPHGTPEEIVVTESAVRLDGAVSSAPPGRSSASTRRPTWIVAMAAAAGIATLALSLRGAVRTTPGSPAPEPAPRTASHAEPEPDLAPSVDPSKREAPTPPVPSAPFADEASVTASSAATARAPTRASPRAVRATPPSARSADCNPPYTIDANNVHVWKRECFK